VSATSRGIGASVAEAAIIALATLATGLRMRWDGCAPEKKTRIYFANHRSHGDLPLIWAALPKEIRRATRPVAGSDYWDKTAARRFIARKVFHCVLIDRNPQTRSENPQRLMGAVLEEGTSLIIFPEGARNMTDATLLPFKTGIFHLAAAYPSVELVPVWIDNLNRVLPKGEFVPIPLLCEVRIGAPLHLNEGEDKQAFLDRSRDSLLALANRRSAP
jgi:1-acyl-sn-glycerol-3-phosphate acyltransferase